MSKKNILWSLWMTLLLQGAMQTVCAQQIGTWEVYPAYWISKHNVVADNKVFCLTTAQITMQANNRDVNTISYNLMAYDTEDTSVKTYDHLNDINDQLMVQMAYNETVKKLILVYENGNIDLMDRQGHVTNISSLKNSSLSSKVVNHVCIDGKMAYLSMEFGFISIDMAEATIQNTYRLGVDVEAITVCDGRIYMGTNDGLYVSTDQNMHVLSNWQKVNGTKSYQGMVTFDGAPYIMNATGVQRWTGSNLQKVNQTENCKYLKVSGGKMLCGNANYVFVFDSATAYEKIGLNNNWCDLSYAKGTYWASEDSNGLHGYRLSNGQFVETVGKVQPNSPIRNCAYRMEYVGDRLLVAGGVNTDESLFQPATAMYLENGVWTNLDEDTPAQQYPNLHHWNTTHLVQDPNDPDHHFASPYRTGLYEYRNGKFVNLYNSENSPLRQISNFGLNYVACCGLKYDADGNLWMMNHHTDTIVRILQPSGKWLALYYAEIAKTPTPEDYVFTSSGVNFLISRRIDGRGYFGFHTNGTLNNVKDDHHLLRTSIVNQDGTSYTPDKFYAMAEDLDGRVWCGNNMGLFVINDPTTFFDNDFVFEQIKIARNDGSGLADYLLSGVVVTCIAVDGANRKWVGTEMNGLYLISADGQEMIQHFQKDNSPLLSDNIQSLAIHPTTGRVMIGTDAGLCSYVSDATEAEEELRGDNVVAYPNPVTPDYNGPIAVRGLVMDSEVKICSASGQVVWSGVSNGGTFTWNGRNKQGKRVASGVYHVVASTADGHKAVVSRIVMIK